MKLKLIQTGGFAGLTKSSEKVMDLSQEEVEDLVNSLKWENEPGLARDAMNHVLVIDDAQKIPFSPEATRGKWKSTIDQMLSELEVEKWK